MRTRYLLSAAALIIVSTMAAAQNAGPQPHGQVPGPNALPPQDPGPSAASPKPPQAVPGAMPDSDAVPSTISEKNARDDKLPTAAYRLKNLTDEQRQTIYRSVAGSAKSNKSTDTKVAPPIDVGMVLPSDLLLTALPPEANTAVPQVKGLQYHWVGDKVVLADPVYREVFAVLAP
jgi:hypothetical protein